MWILKKSINLFEYIQSKSLSSCNSIKTFDFSTLYTGIQHFKEQFTLNNSHNKPISRNKHKLKELAKEFILVPVDKAANNIIIVWRLFYIEVLKKKNHQFTNKQNQIQWKSQLCIGLRSYTKHLTNIDSLETKTILHHTVDMKNYMNNKKNTTKQTDKQTWQFI